MSGRLMTEVLRSLKLIVKITIRKVKRQKLRFIYCFKLRLCDGGHKMISDQKIVSIQLY